ncbi:transposase domain-containing protein [Solidesulfovibrio aerotolerans]|uniref:transposase domain-containing protein n=1 Tax=Solidesulfovibrio aerotolerans TaxID=295255 RepID=UPI001FEC884C|nr:transposase domain-containing protein [Solidesulfovibrio aerotolerans]
MEPTPRPPFYCRINTVKANGLEPRRSLRHRFEHLPAGTTDAKRKALRGLHLDPCLLLIAA